MPSIGETLREARMRQSLDIADVEASTKIRAKYLRALENDEFDRLPGSTFVRSFLRTYAELLGLEPGRLIEEYRLRHEPREELEPHAFAPPPDGRRLRDRRPFGPPSPGVLIAGALVLLLAFLLVLGLTGEEDGGEQQQAAGDATERQQAAREQARQRERERRRRAARNVSMTVTPVEPTYLCVDTGANTQVAFEGIIAEPRTFRGRRIRINLGKPSAQLEVNGQTVEAGQTANPVGFEFTPTERRPLPLGQRPCA